MNTIVTQQRLLKSRNVTMVFSDLVFS